MNNFAFYIKKYFKGSKLHTYEKIVNVSPKIIVLHLIYKIFNENLIYQTEKNIYFIIFNLSKKRKN